MGNNEHECPCGSGLAFGTCCGPFLSGESTPETAEQTMRSRYVGFVRRNADYLAATWHPSTRPTDLSLGEPVKWLGLKILKTEGGGEEDAEGMVEFVARFRSGGGKAVRLHEASRFIRENGVWFYLDGDQFER